MDNKEFSLAVEAYLDGTATSWQKFLIDDHFDSYRNGLDILELYRDGEIKIICERIRAKIHQRIWNRQGI